MSRGGARRARRGDRDRVHARRGARPPRAVEGPHRPAAALRADRGRAARRALQDNRRRDARDLRAVAQRADASEDQRAGRAPWSDRGTRLEGGAGQVGAEAPARRRDAARDRAPGAERRARGRSCAAPPMRSSAMPSALERTRACATCTASPSQRNAGDVGAFFDQSPMIGLANPLAPPITICEDGRAHRARAASRSAAPTRVRPAACTAASSRRRSTRCSASCSRSSGRPGMTGTLIVRYRRPTPLHTAAALRAPSYVRMRGAQALHRRRACTRATCCAPRPRASSSRSRASASQSSRRERAAREADRAR